MGGCELPSLSFVNQTVSSARTVCALTHGALSPVPYPFNFACLYGYMWGLEVSLGCCYSRHYIPRFLCQGLSLA